MWLQFDWGETSRVGAPTQLFCGLLSWSRFRVVLPAWARPWPSAKTVTMDRVAAACCKAPVYNA
jgi:hypothetical protein